MKQIISGLLLALCAVSTTAFAGGHGFPFTPRVDTDVNVKVINDVDPRSTSTATGVGGAVNMAPGAVQGGTLNTGPGSLSPQASAAGGAASASAPTSVNNSSAYNSRGAYGVAYSATQPPVNVGGMVGAIGSDCMPRYDETGAPIMRMIGNQAYYYGLRDTSAFGNVANSNALNLGGGGFWSALFGISEGSSAPSFSKQPVIKECIVKIESPQAPAVFDGAREASVLNALAASSSKTFVKSVGPAVARRANCDALAKSQIYTEGTVKLCYLEADRARTPTSAGK